MTRPRRLRVLLLLFLSSVVASSALVVVQPVTQRGRYTKLCESRAAAGTDSSSYLATIRQALAEQDLLEEWNQSKQILTKEIGIKQEEEEEVEELLATIWNWKAWATVTGTIARRFLPKPIPPDPKRLQTSLEWLKKGPLALPNSVLQTAIREYPTVYLLDPAQTYQQTLCVAPDAYKDPNTFRESLLVDPGILACTYNCIEEGCASECGNCWVTYKPSQS